MSTVAEKVTNKNAALEYGVVEMNRRRPGGKKVYKPHLATKVKWALEDSMERSIAAQRRMRSVLERLDEIHKLADLDMRVQAHLGKLDHELFGLAIEVADLERVVTAALAESKPAK